MAERSPAPGHDDSVTIDPADARQVAYWAAKLEVAPQRLHETIDRVGSRVEDVTRALGGEEQDDGLPGTVTGGPP